MDQPSTAVMKILISVVVHDYDYDYVINFLMSEELCNMGCRSQKAGLYMKYNVKIKQVTVYQTSDIGNCT